MNPIIGTNPTPDEWQTLLRNVASRSNEVLELTKYRRGIPKCDTANEEYDGMSFSKKKQSLITLLLLVNFTNCFQPFSEYLRIEVYFYLRKTLRMPVLAAASLLDAEGCLFLIVTCYHISPRKLFGSILSKERVEFVISRVALRRIRHPRPRRAIRHRGYRDKGTLRPSHRWAESNDFTLRDAQLLREEEAQLFDNTVEQLITGVGDWVFKRYF